MTEFGQNIIPAIYEDNTLRTFSKAGFTSHMVRALQTVGMVPLSGLWLYDPIASPEYSIQEGQTYLFPFDYPDDGGTMTFTVSGTVYRPCFVVAMWHGAEDLVTNPTLLQTHVIVEPAIRLDGDPTLDNIYSMSRTRGAGGLIGFGTPTVVYDTTYPYQDGQQIQKEDWLPNQGSSALNQSELPVGHWFVYLGPGGLQIFVGSGSNRVAYGDTMAMGVLFAGARLPGRAKPVTEDTNLGRINPTLPMFWIESNIVTDGSSFWSTSSSAGLYEEVFRPKIHRMQADLKATDDIVDGWLYNLENVEYPIFPLYQPDTRPSPRVISGGGGGHILSYGVFVPDSREDDSNDKFGPVVPELHASEVRPQWEDVFTGPGWRFCDVGAPLGIHTDPNTLLDWYLFPTYNSGQLVAVYQEGGTIVDTLATVTLTPDVLGPDHYDLTGANGWSNTFPTPTTITETGTSTAVWDDASILDEQTFDVPAQALAQAYEVQWEVTIDSGDPDDTLYQVSYDANNKDDPQSGSANSEGANNLTFEHLFNGAWIVVHTIECAGDNTLYVNSEGELSYSAQTYSAFVPKDTSTGSPQLTFRWQVDGGANQGSDGSVGVIEILKFRYL